MLYSLRAYEHFINKPLLFTNFGGLRHFEAPIQYAIYYSYLAFFRSFMWLKDTNPKADLVFKYILNSIAVVFLFDIVLQLNFPVQYSISLKNGIQGLSVLATLYIFYLLFSQKITKQGGLLVLGGAFLISAALFSLFVDSNEGRLEYIWAGWIRKYELSGHYYYYPNISFALLFECVCFTLALNIRWQEEFKTKQHLTILLENFKLEKFRSDVLLEQTLAEKQKIDAQLETLRQVKQFNETALNQLVEEKKGIDSHLKNIIQKNSQLENQLTALTEKIKPNNENDNHFFSRGLNIVETNFTNPDFGAEEFAKAMNTSTANFTKLWKKQTNESPYEYIRNFRLDHAMRLLLGTENSIATIAEASGFNDAANFSTAFTQKFGMSPNKFRIKNGD